MPCLLAEPTFDKHNYAEIMQVQTISNLRSAKFNLKLISPNIPKLVMSSDEFKFVSEHIFFYIRAVRRIYESSFHGWCRHLLFFNSVPETKKFCTFYSINFASHLQKEIPAAAVSGKKKSIAKAVALNYISTKVYRITHHDQVLIVTAARNATWENQKVRNIITRYRAMSN